MRERKRGSGFLGHSSGIVRLAAILAVAGIYNSAQAAAPTWDSADSFLTVTHTAGTLQPAGGPFSTGITIVAGTAPLAAPFNAHTFSFTGGSTAAKAGMGHSQSTTSAGINLAAGTGVGQTDPLSSENASSISLNFNAQWSLNNGGSFGPPVSGSFSIPVGARVGAKGSASVTINVFWDAIIDGTLHTNVRNPYSANQSFGAGTTLTAFTAPTAAFSPTSFPDNGGANDALIMHGIITFTADNEDTPTLIGIPTMNDFPELATRPDLQFQAVMGFGPSTATWPTASSGNWTNDSNWVLEPNNSPPVAGDLLQFSGAAGGTSHNDFAANTGFGGLNFLFGAGAYTLTGNQILLAGNINDNSVSTQTINLPMQIQEDQNVNVAGGGTLILGGLISGSAALSKTGVGNLTLSNSNSYAGGTNVLEGSVTITPAGSIASNTVAVSGGATLNVMGGMAPSTALTVGGSVNFVSAPGSPRNISSLTLSSGGVVTTNTANPGPPSVLHVSALNFGGDAINGWQGSIDLMKNNLVVSGGNITDIASQLKSGYSAGSWTGSTGIRSSAAAADPNHFTTLGYVLSNGSLVQPLIAGDVVVDFTLYGDGNLDNTVDTVDLSQWVKGFLGTPSGSEGGWFYGDYNYDGVSDYADLALLGRSYYFEHGNENALLNFINQDTSLTPAQQALADVAIPEPTTISLLGIGALGLLGRRRSKVNLSRPL
jgi:autotransporter-associated beta strand protein